MRGWGEVLELDTLMMVPTSVRKKPTFPVVEATFCTYRPMTLATDEGRGF